MEEILWTWKILLINPFIREAFFLYNLDQLLSYLVFITIVTFIFERAIENLLIPFIPTGDLKYEKPVSPHAAQEVAVSGVCKSRRTLILLLIMYGLGFGISFADPRFRFFAGGLGLPTHPFLDSIFTAALIAGGSQPLHSMVEKVRQK